MSKALNKIIKTTSKYLDTLERQSTPSGEENENTIHYLETQEYLSGLIVAKKCIGNCNICKFGNFINNYILCSKTNKKHTLNWYCADFIYKGDKR